jgi:AsmA protein
MDTVIAENLNLDFKKIYFNDAINPNLFATMYFDGNVKAKSIKSSSFYLSDSDFDILVTNGSYRINSDVMRLLGENAKGKAEFTFAPFSDVPSYQLILDNVQFQSEKMLKTFMEDTVLTGPLRLSLDLKSTGSEWDSIVSNLSGTIQLSGNNLLFIGMDADVLIEKFKRSQSFNLVDLGAVVLAGPVGIAVTKGSDYAQVLLTNKGESSKINNLVSSWNLVNGNFIIEDAAFSTAKNRVASIGSIDFSKDSLDLTIALLNSYGCSVFSQRVYGDLNEPIFGKVKVVGTVLAPVTNLVDDILGTECQVFYQGKVQHPK